MEIIILGCGPSSGVPFYGNKWGDCNSQNIKNNRTRSSVFVEERNTKLIIDTGPDFRQQILRENISDVDAFLYTHDHADHTHGIDEIRGLSFLNEKKYPFWTDAETYRSLTVRFSYLMMKEGVEQQSHNAIMRPNIIQGPFTVGDLEIIPFEQDHGFSKSLGFRIGDFAYSTDVVDLNEQAFEILQGVKVWIVDALVYEHHPKHSHVAKTLSWIERVGPERAFLTHMSGLLDYDTLCAELPPHVSPCYDGLRIYI